MLSDRPHKRACHRCGGDMTDGQKRRQERDERVEIETMDELDSIYAHLRALAANAPGDWKHAIVGLLPECQSLPAELREKLPRNLVERQEQMRREAWAEYGYTEERSTGPGTAATVHLCECGHPIEDHVESEWGPHTVCVQKLDDGNAGFHGVCPCVRREDG